MKHYTVTRGFGSARHVRERATGRIVSPPLSRIGARREARRRNRAARAAA